MKTQPPGGDGLAVEGLCAGYGRIEVVRDVTLSVAPGEIVSLLGRNGAGKTTTLLAVAGLLHPTAGEVRLAGRRLTARPAALVAREGLALVPAGHRIFRELTVAENLRVGAFGRRRSVRSVASELATAFELFPSLVGRGRQIAGELSGGEQQMVAIGQALLARPGILLLDEPSFGLAPAVVDVIYDALRRLAAEGIGVLVVEQEVERALGASHRLYVMEGGRIVRAEQAGRLTAEEVAEIMLVGQPPAAAEQPPRT